MQVAQKVLDKNIDMVPWPSAEDRLFREDPDWSHNACLDLGGKGWESYATGYKEAADALVDRFLAKELGVDSLAYPIVFLYRHYLELSLKQILLTGRTLLHQTPDFEEIHGLDKLWSPCRQILKQIWPKESCSTWDNVGRLIHEFAKHDPAGMNFRYPLTTKSKAHLMKSRQPTLPHLNRVGIRNLYKVMQRLHSFFEAHLTGIDIYLNAADS